jgi:uncharacterized membrane protein required for colicin V production
LLRVSVSRLVSRNQALRPREVRVNLIDLLFLLIFFGMLSLGFFQGMIRLAILIISFYLSLVLASLYFPFVGDFLVRNFGAQRFVGQYVGFALSLGFSFVLLATSGIYTFRYAQLPGGLDYIDKIIGVLLGMVLGALLLGIIAVLLWNLMIMRGGRTIDFPLMRALGDSVANSFLLQYFANSLLPQAYRLADPFLPDSASLIFVVQ